MGFSLFSLFFLLLDIQGEYLSYNPTLEKVARYRQQYAVEKPLDKKINLEAYECLIGVPHGYKNYIGREVIFRQEDGKYSGVWLVVDVEQKKHAGMMDDRNLLADVDCLSYVHKKGILILIREGR